MPGPPAERHIAYCAAVIPRAPHVAGALLDPLPLRKSCTQKCRSRISARVFASFSSSLKLCSAFHSSTFLDLGLLLRVQSEVEFGPRVGEGAFGDVYLAKSPTFGHVAVKWLKTDKV